MDTYLATPSTTTTATETGTATYTATATATATTTATATATATAPVTATASAPSTAPVYPPSCTLFSSSDINKYPFAITVEPNANNLNMSLSLISNHTPHLHHLCTSPNPFPTLITYNHLSLTTTISIS